MVASICMYRGFLFDKYINYMFNLDLTRLLKYNSFFNFLGFEFYKSVVKCTYTVNANDLIFLFVCFFG